jgi:hypothetical protein
MQRRSMSPGRSAGKRRAGRHPVFSANPAGALHWGLSLHNGQRMTLLLTDAAARSRRAIDPQRILLRPTWDPCIMILLP